MSIPPPPGVKLSDYLQINDFRTTPKLRLEAASRITQTCTPDLPRAVCEIDLHCHSFYSDGYNSPSMLVLEAFRRGMKGIAVSDHDVIDGQREAIAAGQIFNIEIIPAIEFYTDRPGIEIIAHFPDIPHFLKLLEDKAFDPICEPIRAAKKKQLSAMLARIPGCMNKYNFDAEITEDNIDQYLRNGISTKGDISVAMWQKHGLELAEAGIADDVKDFQAKYTTKDDQLNLPLDLDIDLSPEAFVKRVRELGGLPGIAHPTELRRKEKLGNEALYKIIEDLTSIGLQTFEVDGWRNEICPECGLYQTELFEQLRQRWNSEHPDCPPLLFTNGADSHNQPGEGLELGCGKNRNMKPEFGQASNLECLLKRQHSLL
jgi:3',5'-nucleoside bisphosphate phosphatase